MWKYIGFVLGIEYDDEVDPLRDYATARSWIVQVFDSIIKPDFARREESTTRMLSAHVLKAIAFGTEMMHFRVLPWQVDVRGLIESVFAVMASAEYVALLKFNPASWRFELPIRVGVGLVRTLHILLELFCLKGINVWVAKRMFDKYANVVTYDLMEKRGNYKCRFAKYM